MPPIYRHAPESLHIHNAAAAELLCEWVQTWKHYGLRTCDRLGREDRVGAGVYATGGEWATFATFATNVEKIHPVLDQFEAYCRPRRNVPFERFYKRQQQSGETFDQYVTELPQLAINCNFYDITPEEILRHIILFEIAGGRVKEARMI